MKNVRKVLMEPEPVSGNVTPMISINIHCVGDANGKMKCKLTQQPVLIEKEMDDAIESPPESGFDYIDNDEIIKELEKLRRNDENDDSDRKDIASEESADEEESSENFEAEDSDDSNSVSDDPEEEEKPIVKHIPKSIIRRRK